MKRALVLLCVLSPGLARADGGVLRSTRADGPFVVSLFTAPEPLRAGRADLSVLVQSRHGDVLLDAGVTLQLTAPDGSERTVAASHAAASNGLLQAALLELPAPGRWQVTVAVRQATSAASLRTDLEVAPATSRLAAQWAPLALPPACIVLFAWRERLLRRRKRPQ